MPIRDLAYFASKEKKFGKEISKGRERGTWVKTIQQNVDITTSQTSIIADFIANVIKDENLNPNDIIMLKYLQMVDTDNYSIYKIFKSVDVKDKLNLLHIINVYADGFFGKNEDYSEDIDRLEIDVIKAIQGGCGKREMKTNDSTKRITTINPLKNDQYNFYRKTEF
jgi:hypothetical protein